MSSFPETNCVGNVRVIPHSAAAELRVVDQAPEYSELLGRSAAGVAGGETKSSLERSVFVFVYIITGGGGEADPASRRSGALNDTLMKHPCLEESGGGRGGGDGPQKKNKKKKKNKSARGKIPQTCFVSSSRRFDIYRI